MKDPFVRARQALSKIASRVVAASSALFASLRVYQPAADPDSVLRVEKTSRDLLKVETPNVRMCECMSSEQDREREKKK